MRPSIALLALLLAACLAALAPCAFAGVPVELNTHPQSHGPQITLADLFDAADGPAGTVVVATAAPAGQTAVLDASHVQIVARQAGLDWSNERGQHRIAVEAGASQPLATLRVARGGASRSALRSPVAATVAATAQALVYTRNVPAGDLVSADDLAWAEVPAASHLSDPIADPDAAAGKIARRPLHAGAPALGRDLVGATVVHKGDIVAVVFRDDGMQLTLQGRALTDAAAGDAAQILNIASKKVVDAVVTGPGRALVGPEADAARLTHYASVR